MKQVTVVVREWSGDVIKKARENLNTPGFDGQPKGRKKSNTGKLADSLGYSIRVTNNQIIVEFKSTENYAAIVEEGRKAGSKMPPAGAIDRWVTQRNLKGSRDKGGRFVARKRMVFAIRRSIGKNGIKPVRFFSKAMNEVFDQLPDKLQTALINDLSDIIFNNFTKNGFTVTKT